MNPMGLKLNPVIPVVDNRLIDPEKKRVPDRISVKIVFLVFS
jgi:hypothetical protein